MLREAKGFGGNTFKIELARRTIVRALSQAARGNTAVAVQQEDRVSTAMAPYIGTATSRIDGIAKVTGAAKYAAEFNTPGLAARQSGHLDDHQGPHHAHRRQRRQSASRACSPC